MKRFILLGIAACGLTLCLGGCPSGTEIDDGTTTDTGGSSGAGGRSGGSGGGGGSGGILDRSTITRPSSPTLFVADPLRGIMSFAGANTLNGDVAPTSNNLIELSAGLGQAAAVVVDRKGTLILHDVQTTALLFYDGAAATTSDADTSREIRGSATRLGTLPEGIAIDRERDRLFVATSDRVLIYEGADLTKSGDVPPTRFFSSADLPGGGHAIALGPNGDLYVSTEDEAVLVFANAGSRTGAIGADRLIRLPDFRTIAVFVDAQDRLYVGDAFNKIAVLDSAATLNGEAQGFREIQLAGVRAIDEEPFEVRTPCIAGIAVDSRGIGYVSDTCNGAVHVIDDLAGRTGDVTADRAITGPNTLLPGPGALFLWE